MRSVASGASWPSSLEAWTLGPRSLELVETRSTGHQEHDVKEFAGALAPRGGGHDGAEDCDLAHVNHRRTHLVTDRIHALVVARAQGLVELGARRGVREIGLKP